MQNIKMLAKKYLSYLPLVFCFIWTYLNIYFLPFYPWTCGLVRPWFILKGLVPYRDFVWIRMPADLFILTGWYRLFGVTPQAYQLFICTLFLLIPILIFIISKRFWNKYGSFPIWFFTLFIFPLFINTEVGEVLIGFFILILYYLLLSYNVNRQRKYLFLSGLISGVLFLTKQTTIFAISGAFLWLIWILKKNNHQLKSHLGIYLIGILLPLLLTIAYFVYYRALTDFFYYTITFILTSYTRAPHPGGDGMWMGLGFILLIVTYVTSVIKKEKIRSEMILTLCLPILLISMLLPSYLSYRAFPMFPMVSFIGGFTLWGIINDKKNRLIYVVAILLFFIGIYRYVPQYISFVANNRFMKNQLLTDYTETEYEISRLVKQNSQPTDKILIFANDIIYLFTDRLPATKYIDPFPYLLYPFEQSSKEVLENPPKLFMFDKTLSEYHHDLEDWPFLLAVPKLYHLIKKVDTVSIYKLR